MRQDIPDTQNNITESGKAFGRFVYENGKLSYIIHADGVVRAVYSTPGWGSVQINPEMGITIMPADGEEVLSGFTREIHLKDHLGNVRAVFDYSKLQSENHYYPFGLPIHNLCTTTAPEGKENRYLYNGKELQDDLGLNWMDYGARFYDAGIGRWHSADPMAEVSRRWSSYSYCYNNPIRFIDPDGRLVGDFINERGENIGNDGKQDGKVYVIKTTKTDFDSGVSSAGISEEKAAETESFITNNSGDASAFEANNIAYENSVEIEGSTSTRQAMVDIVNKDNGNGLSSKPGNNTEFGGTLDKGIAKEVAPSNVGSLKNKINPVISFPGDTGGAFHSHPSGTYTPMNGTNSTSTMGGTTKSDVWKQAPSKEDVSNAGNNTRYVFGMRDKTVYIYSGSGVIATVPQKYFVKPK